MRGKRLGGFAIALVSLLIASPSYSQDGDVYWRIDPHVKTCSMVIDPSLTQAQWGTYTRQVGAIASFKSLASAEPLGTGNFTLGIDRSSTPVDQHDPAWINTFTHPDASCPLGDQVSIPTLRARVGVSSRMDVGGFWSAAPRANYGLVGGELKYSFLRESAKVPAAAVSASVAVLTGVPDYDLGVYAVGLAASKRIAMFTPYLGVRQGLIVGTETTAKVDLNTERLPLTQGFVGAACSVWKLGLAAEFDLAEVNTLTFAIAFHPRARSR